MYNPQYAGGQQQQQQQPWQQQQGGYYGVGGQQQQPPAYDPANRGYFGGDGSATTPSTGVYEMQPPGRTFQSPEVSGGKR